MNARRWAAIALAVLGAIAPSGETRAQAGGLTLREALRTALAHNRVLNATRQQGVAARAGLTQARAGFLPQLDADETFTETNNPTLVFSNLLNQQRFTQDNFAVDSLNHPSSLANFDTRIRIEQPLFAGGKLLAGLDAARQGVAAADGQQGRAEQETVFQTRRAYYGILLADGNLTAVDRALASAREHLDTARALFDRGVVVRSDLLRADVLVGSLERQRIDADNATRTTRSQLNYVMGTDGEIRLQDTDAWPALAAPPVLEQSIEIALHQRPDLQAREHEWRRNEAMRRQAQGDYLPSLGVIGQYNLNSEKFSEAGDSYAVFVGAKWNLFNGLATTGKARESAAQAERSRLLYEDLSARLRVEVEQAWRGLTGATRQVEVAERNQQQAQENLSIVRDRYAGGLARSVDVLDAVATAEQAEVELLQARVSRQVRYAELDLATGQPAPVPDSEAP
jgi:outer membrane protein